MSIWLNAHSASAGVRRAGSRGLPADPWLRVTAPCEQGGRARGVQRDPKGPELPLSTGRATEGGAQFVQATSPGADATAGAAGAVAAP